MRDTISTTQFLFSVIINGINSLIMIIITIFLFISGNFKFFLFLTMWTYYLNSIYLLINLISDVALLCFHSQYLERLNHLNRNKFSPICNTLSYTIVTLFWLLLSLGKDWMVFEMNNPVLFMFNLYLHGLNMLFVIIDLFVADHDKIDFSWITLGFISLIFWLYALITGIGKVKFNFCPYVFVEKGTIGQLIVAAFAMYMFAVVGYRLHLRFLEFKYYIKKKLGWSDENGEITVGASCEFNRLEEPTK